MLRHFPTSTTTTTIPKMIMKRKCQSRGLSYKLWALENPKLFMSFLSIVYNEFLRYFEAIRPVSFQINWQLPYHQFLLILHIKPLYFIINISFCRVSASSTPRPLVAADDDVKKSSVVVNNCFIIRSCLVFQNTKLRYYGDKRLEQASSTNWKRFRLVSSPE